LLPHADGRGRVLAAELLLVTSTVRELIRDPARTVELKDTIEKGRIQYGMQSFDQHLIELYRAQQITLDTARAAASSPEDLQRAIDFG
jgi:twitching motility protein PilT